MFYLFWALYGYSPPEYGNLVLAEHVETVGNNTIVYVNKHSFTQTVGYTMLTIYNIIAIIILVNVFIAMMSNSFMAVEVGIGTSNVHTVPYAHVPKVFVHIFEVH